MKRLNTFFAIAAAVCLSIAVGRAEQVVITVNSDGDLSTGVSDTITVQDLMGNNIFPMLTVQEADEVGGVTFSNSTFGNWNLPNTLFLNEPSGATSEILTLQNQGNRAFIYFTSDDEAGKLGPIPIITPQFTFNEGANGITVIGNFSISTPEPSALVPLAGFVLAGLGWRLRRTKKA